jgi:hypothetical protein
LVKKEAKHFVGKEEAKHFVYLPFVVKRERTSDVCVEHANDTFWRQSVHVNFNSCCLLKARREKRKKNPTIR